MTVKGNEVGRNDIQFGAGYSELDGFFGQAHVQHPQLPGPRRDPRRVAAVRPPHRLLHPELHRALLPRPADPARRLDLQDQPELPGHHQPVHSGPHGRRPDRRPRGRHLQLGDRPARLRGRLVAPSPSPAVGFPAIRPRATCGRSSRPGSTRSCASWRRRPSPARRPRSRPGFAYDSRDDPFDPNRGTRFTFRPRFAGGPLGGDFDYIRPEVSFSLFHPLTKRSVAAVNVEGGQFFPYNDSEIPIYERYRLGGERSLRGLPYYSVLPRNENGRLLPAARRVAPGRRPLLAAQPRVPDPDRRPGQVDPVHRHRQHLPRGAGLGPGPYGTPPASSCGSSCRSSRRRSASSTANRSHVFRRGRRRLPVLDRNDVLAEETTYVPFARSHRARSGPGGGSPAGDRPRSRSR